MNCPLCNSKKIKIVYTNPLMPLGINVKEEILDIEVALCAQCNFVFQKSAYNNEYDSVIKKLYESYTISSMYKFPNRNNQHINALSFIEEVIENREDFNVLEIGSNRGDFLYLVKEKFTKVNILGFEPTTFKNLKVPTINSFFDETLLNNKFNLIILRHTLEHIKYPQEFMKRVNSLLSEDGKLFIEVPNLDYSLTEMIEDFTPDHVNFFTSRTLINTVSNMKCIKMSNETFLYAVFEKSKTKIEEELPLNIDYIDAFNRFSMKIKEVKNICKEHERILFYGISNFYLWTYTKLKKLLEGKEIGFIDDNIEEDTLFGLKKVDDVKEGDLIILCSSNLEIQSKMIKNLPKKTKVLRLFKGLDYV